ncbi:hypothetical protein C1H46_018493 [Malus baccata]|uniref:Uncharacterized protein n=1 Tax=Malus baccata TaxID=106549 RepID=A0A540MAT4_MALBA|nr:hypothetical protein C1H46_018493 [Malus baccata]
MGYVKKPLLWSKPQYTWPRWKSGKPLLGEEGRGIVREGNKAGNHIRPGVF